MTERQIVGKSPAIRMSSNAITSASMTFRRPGWNRLSVFPFALAMLLATGARSHAQLTSIWIGNVLTGTGNWSTGLWDVLPIFGDNVVINNLTFPAVVTLDVNATVNQLTLGTGATLIIGNQSLQLNANSTINGSLTLNAATGSSQLLIGAPSLTLAGAGTITMSANANNQIRGSVSTNGLINQVTIQGGGSIGAGQMSLSNQGTITANTPAIPLIIQPNASGVTNTGTLTATNNSTLSLLSGSFNNTGGTIQALNGSTVMISNSTVAAGNITTVGTGTVKLSDATLAGVTVTNSANGLIQAFSGISTLYGFYSDTPTSQMRISNGAKIILPSGAANVTFNGGIYLDSTGSSTIAEIGTTALTINGPGKVVMSDNANNRFIGSGPSSAITFGSNLTVRGSGQLGGGLLGITNQGTIIADQSNALIIQPNSMGVTNSGTFRSTGGATLTLQGGTFTNSGAGLIAADNNSHVDVSGAKIIGGVLTSVGAGHFHALDSSTFSGVTISSGSTIELGDGHALTLAGSIVNNGLVTLLSTGGVTDLKIDSSVTLGGTGSITLSDSANNRISAASAGSALSIGTGQTIVGAGEIGRDALSLTNLGTITANRSTALVVNNSGTSFTNAGTLKATGTGGLTLADATVINQGVVEVSSGSVVNVAGNYTQSGTSSVTKLGGGTFTATTFAPQGGTLTGSGTINGTVAASGTSTIVPGGVAAAGTLTFNSSLNLGSTTGLYFDLGGTTAGTGHDRINGTSVTLNGSLFLSFTNGFQSTVSNTDTLTLINTSTALSGTFASLPNGSRLTTADGFGSFQVNYLTNSLTISNFQAIPEPSTYMLLGAGAFSVLIAHRRRRRQK